MRLLPQFVRRATAHQIDEFVLRRMSVLVDRAGRGVGPRRADVEAALARALERPSAPGTVVDAFHRQFYDEPTTWRSATYRGVTTWKNPLDVWVYQEIISEIRPDLIVETGTAYGGSALYLSDLCETLGHGRVVTIDVGDRARSVEHPRLTKIVASSVDPQVRERVDAMVPAGGTVLVVLDSDHRRDHVLGELRLWADLVTAGSYLIVEDTNINGHPVYPDFGPGPWEAVEEFLAERDDFVVDDEAPHFLMTWNPRGYLKKAPTTTAG